MLRTVRYFGNSSGKSNRMEKKQPGRYLIVPPEAGRGAQINFIALENKQPDPVDQASYGKLSSGGHGTIRIAGKNFPLAYYRWVICTSGNKTIFPHLNIPLWITKIYSAAAKLLVV